MTATEPGGVPVRSDLFADPADYRSFKAEFQRRCLQQGSDLTSQQALVLAVRCHGELTSAWNDYELEEAPLGGRLETMLDPIQYALLKLFLDQAEPERVEALDRAYADGGSLDLSEFDWHGSWIELLRFQYEAVGERFEDPLESWTLNQLESDALLARRPLLDNLWMFVLLPRMVRCLTALQARRAGKREAGPEEYREALTLAEGYLGPTSPLPSRLAPRFTAPLRGMLNA